LLHTCLPLNCPGERDGTIAAIRQDADSMMVTELQKGVDCVQQDTLWARTYAAAAPADKRIFSARHF
jgi:hypothetical protein